jgi:hypothetical protein
MCYFQLKKLKIPTSRIFVSKRKYVFFCIHCWQILLYRGHIVLHSQKQLMIGSFYPLCLANGICHKVVKHRKWQIQIFQIWYYNHEKVRVSLSLSFQAILVNFKRLFWWPKLFCVHVCEGMVYVKMYDFAHNSKWYILLILLNSE